MSNVVEDVKNFVKGALSRQFLLVTAGIVLGAADLKAQNPYDNNIDKTLGIKVNKHVEIKASHFVTNPQTGLPTIDRLSADTVPTEGEPWRNQYNYIRAMRDDIGPKMMAAYHNSISTASYRHDDISKGNMDVINYFAKVAIQTRPDDYRNILSAVGKIGNVVIDAVTYAQKVKMARDQVNLLLDMELNGHDVWHKQRVYDSDQWMLCCDPRAADWRALQAKAIDEKRIDRGIDQINKVQSQSDRLKTAAPRSGNKK